SDATSLHASWTSSDPQSGVADYSYCIGTSPGADDAVPWTDAGLATQTTKSGLSLQNGVTYYFSVKAMNGGGGWSAAGSSDGITVDTTPPNIPSVTGPGRYLASLTTITASWQSSDPESGIAEYDYSVGTSPGGTQVLSWKNAGLNTSAVISGLSLTEGGTYYVNVRATNGALILGPVGSSGAITVDTTPPTTPVVVDDGAFTNSNTQLHASWSSTDPESGITDYKYSLGTSPGATDVIGWTDAGVQTSVTLTGLSLVDKQIYYFNVVSINGAENLAAVGSSDGITVETDAPSTPVVTVPNKVTIDHTQLQASWSAQDPVSGIADYSYCIGTSPGANNVVDWTDAGLNTSVTKTGL
ncbi:MAG: hypothetical protein M1482_12285, partial [Chloroflexi bacterium]|nr:hypothetical protein [Chloroflexota bacterium]